MPTHSARNDLPVVAIGASAGGLDACRALLRDMPGSVDAAFVLILHLDPTHDSMMVDLLAGHTALTVVQAKNGMTLQPGVLHVIPPGLFLTVDHRTLHLSEPKNGRAVRHPFDVLLRSLAADVGARTACIVLSGTASDGSAGLERIHAAGGLVIAQDPSEAGYPGMPQSAIKTGLVDAILPTAQMGAAIKSFAEKNQRGVEHASDPTADDTTHVSLGPNTDQAGFDDLLAFVGDFAAQDISLYKRGTLERRIARRMALLGLGQHDVARYLAILRRDADEQANLSADLLIHVTGFFRDPAVFDHLSDVEIPALVAAIPADRPLRVWVAGCSTGEEAYSLAIVCLEAMATAGTTARLQILASDIDPEAVATARAGFYPKEIETVVSAERLSRYFVAQDGGYRVASALRDVIVFTVADLLIDPPFSKIDLVSCRNVLIYLGPEAQKRVIARCCFALRTGGLLLLGAAEMPGHSDGCFAVVDKDARLWRRVGQSHPSDLHFVIGKRESAAAPAEQMPVRRGVLADLCRRIVLDTYAPAAVLLNDRLECLYFLGPTERYLKITQGHPDQGLLGILPKALRARFRTAVAACTPQNARVTISGGRLSDAQGFDIVVHAVTAGWEQLYLVCFVDTPKPSARATGPDDTAPDSSAPSARDTADLEADLEAMRSDLSDALRDLEQAVEAHGADAAEALSVNEEFQSTNEELLASKEELQSLNEELTALNSQLQETLERHRTTANDLQNVLFSTDVATLFLDLDLNIRFFTPAARTIFRVIPTDIGRPLADLAGVSDDENLAGDCRSVLTSGDATERETNGVNGQWFQRRVQPYRTEGGHIEGVVITYANITDRKRTNAALKAATLESDRATRAKSRFLASASHDLRQPLQAMALLNQLLLPKKRTTEGVRLALLMDQTLNSMTGMLDSMLDVNRIDSGIVRPNMRPMAIAPLLQRLADEYAPQCDLKGLKLRSVPCTAWVRTDPQLLEQMLRNLLSNALRYTPKGGILLGCRHHGDSVSVLVCDTGIGVAETESSQIFEAYHQGEKAAAFGGHGIGLGLSIVQRLGQLMEHPVAVRSTPGKGSTFRITLPVVNAAHDGTPHAMMEPMPPGARQTGTILLVEDEEPLKDLLQEVLVNEGHTVIAMSNATEALAWASEEDIKPDLLLTDFDLHGGTNGLRLAQDLPDILGSAVPTIILTGDITIPVLKRIAATDHDQISKPVMPEILLAQISDLLHKARDKNVRLADAKTAETTIYIVDDDPMIRESTRRLFEAEGWAVATFGSAEDFLARPRSHDRACLLVDNILPGIDGITLISQLRDQGAHLPSVMLTGHGDAATAVAALKAGASDLIEKPTSAAELLASVRRALKGDDDGSTRSQLRKSAQKQFADLTAREREVLTHVLAGKPNKIIAADLGINQRTVENHRASLMRKSGAKSLPALVRIALAAET